MVQGALDIFDLSIQPSELVLQVARVSVNNTIRAMNSRQDASFI